MKMNMEEKELVMVDDEEDSSSTTSSSKRRRKEKVLRLDNFIPKGSLRVLLIEGDDSTRQIIAALLRKCNYKVTAVADGLKAWEMLKERASSIDVILTEVALSSLTGTDLLSKITDRESCKHIPVIMMSYNDSVNMAFKCMLKGAADFLVKPIRKNELRNLWQHVWRKHNLSGGHGAIKVHKDGDAKKKLETVENNKECCEKRSDAESSCRNSDMEAQSTYKQNSMEPQKMTLSSTSLDSDTLCQTVETKTQENAQLPEEEHSCAEVDATMTQYARPKEAITTYEMEDQTCVDLIGAINNQQQFGYYGLKENASASNNNFYGASEVISRDEDFSFKSSSVPLLELSLRRNSHASIDMEEDKKECSTLNHSDSSPFSPYNNNNRKPVSSLSRAVTFLQGEGEEYYHENPFTKQKTSDKGNGASNQNEIATKCTPIRVIPLQFPFGGTALQPSFYPGTSSQILWNANPSMMQNGIKSNNTSNQSDTSLDFYASQNRILINQSPKSQILHSTTQIEHVNKELRDESSSICHGSSASHIDSVNGFRRIVNEVTVNNTSTNFSHVNVSELRNQDGKTQADLDRINLREAALNKFRLKRKDRCFEKKVRYQSRKKLAEQRPRVKGQFVRHIQPHASSAASYQIEPALG